MATDDIRNPDIIENLRTHPGGDRQRGRFDPRVKALWKLLVDHTDSETFEIVVNVTETANDLNVARSTVQRWLAFLEEHKLLQVRRRSGGRGRGILVEMTWLKQGQKLADRRQRALAYKREQEHRSAETVAQGQTAFVSKESSTRECPCPDDSVTSGQLMQRVRLHTQRAMRNDVGAKAIQDLIGRALFRDGVAPEDLEVLVLCLEFRKHIYVPRWAKTAAAIYRWARATLRALWEELTDWWRRLDRAWERAEVQRAEARVALRVDGWAGTILDPTLVTAFESLILSETQEAA